ncbi:MAG: RNA-binding domain-containing protein [Candidatus Thorarchaeota archaeon]
MDVLISCPVYPTEDILRVKRALETIIGPQNITTEKNDEISELVFTSSKRETLNIVRHTIHDLRIIDTARKRLRSNWNGTSTQIYFDKQAAFIGKLRIIDDSTELPPLSAIEVSVVFKDKTQFDEFLLWFTPPTKNGRILN